MTAEALNTIKAPNSTRVSTAPNSILSDWSCRAIETSKRVAEQPATSKTDAKELYCHAGVPNLTMIGHLELRGDRHLSAPSNGLGGVCGGVGAVPRFRAFD